MVSRLKRVARAIDRGLGRVRRTRDVLVEVRTPVYLAVLGPVVDGLRALPDVRIWFTGEYPDRITPLVEPGSFLTHAEVEWRRFDLYLNGDPWAAARLRRCDHRVNFFHGVAGKYDLDDPRHLPMGFEYYDRVAFINRDRMARYLAAGIVTPAQARLVGYPKLDRLAKGATDVNAVRSALRLDASRPTALYAPTYSPASSLHIAGEAIIRALAGSGCNVIVKLHDRSLDPDPKYSGGVDWRAVMHTLAGGDAHVHYVEGADASPYLAAADLMVTDHSSVGFEFLVLDRPLIVYNAPGLATAARINPEKIQLLRRAATVVHTPEELAATAGAELRHPARLSTIRRQVAEDMFHDPGHATGRALHLIRELLLPAPRQSDSRHEAPVTGSAS